VVHPDVEARVRRRAWFIDAAVAFVVVAFIAIWAGSSMSPPDPVDTKLDARIEVLDERVVDSIADAAQQERWVYFNSVDREVEVVSVERADNRLVIVLRAPGALGEEGEATFNGQRLLIGQWVEIRASYFAQGTVIDVAPAGT